MARGGVTPADLHDVAFSKPPIGKLGYDEREVDAFLARVKTDLSGRVPRTEEPIRCLLHRYASSDQQTPVLAIDVGTAAIRMTDLNGCDPNNGDSNNGALVASAFLAEVTAKPTQYGGIAGLVLDGPGLQDLTIQPHPPPGECAQAAQVEEARLPCPRGGLALARREIRFGVGSGRRTGAADLPRTRWPFHR
jgi:DivIVA domain-containing protein